MTVVVALRHGADLWIGSDERCTSDTGFIYPPVRKFRRFDGNKAVGWAGSHKAGTIMRSLPFIAAMRDVWDPYSFCDTLHASEPMNAILKTERGRPEFVFLVEGRIWEVTPGLDFQEMPDHTAIGCGAAFSLGAIEACAHEDIAAIRGPAEVLRIAIEAAIKYDANCGGEVRMHCLPGGDGADNHGVD